MNRNVTEYELAKTMISQVRTMSEKKLPKKKLIREEKGDESKNDAIAITNDAKFGENVLQNQIAALGGAVTGGGVGYAMGDSKPNANMEPPENPSGPGEQNDDFAPGVEPHGTDYKNPKMTGGKYEGPSTPEHINQSGSSS